jgi:hypothetical protein
MTVNIAAFQHDMILTIEGCLYGIRRLGGEAVGSTSFIYLAYRWNTTTNQPAGEPLILKRFNPAEQAYWAMERNVLHGVAPFDGADGAQHFPRLLASTEQYIGGQASFLLLMDYAGSRHAAMDLPFSEGEGLLLLHHYLTALIALAHAGFTCWDRKLKDFFWEPPDPLDYPAGRLVIIDWNMAEIWSASSMMRDLTQTGRMLYELLTGLPALKRAGSSSYDLDRSVPSQAQHNGRPLRRYSQLSFAAQDLIETLLAGSRAITATSDSPAVVKERLIEHLTQLSKRCLSLSELWQSDVTPLMDKAEAYLRQQDWEAALAASSIAILKEQPDAVGWLDVRLQLPKHQATYEQAKQEVFARRNHLTEIQRQLVAEQINEARAALGNLLASHANLSLEAELDLLRWALLVDTIQDDGDVRQLGSLVPTLRTVEQALHQGNFLAAGQASLALPVVGTIFNAEARVREYAQRGDRHFINHEYSQARQTYEAARALLPARSQEGALEDRYWALVSDIVGDLDAHVQQAAELAGMEELPAQKLAAAQQLLPSFEFEAARRLLEEGLAANPLASDLIELHAITRQLAYLKRLVGNHQRLELLTLDSFLLSEAITYAGELCQSLRPAYRLYPEQMIAELQEAGRLIEQSLKAKQYPASVAQWQAFGQHVDTLLQVLRASGNQQRLGIDAQELEKNSMIFKQQREQAEFVDQIATSGSRAMTPTELQSVLELARKLGLQTLSNGQQIDSELERLRQAQQRSIGQLAQTQFDTLRTLIIDQLPYQTSAEQAQRFLDELHAQLSALRSTQSSQQADMLLQWLEASRAPLLLALSTRDRIHPAMETLACSAAPCLEPFLNPYIAQLSGIRQTFEQLRQSWPQQLGAAPELTKLMLSGVEIGFWQRRAATLAARLPSATVTPNLAEITRVEEILLGLEECQQQLGALPQHVLTTSISDYRRELDTLWSTWFAQQSVVEADKIQVSASNLLANQAHKFADNQQLIPALWLALAAQNISSANNTRLATLVDELLTTMAQSGQPDIEKALTHGFEATLMSPSYQGRFREQIVQDLAALLQRSGWLPNQILPQVRAEISNMLDDPQMIERQKRRIAELLSANLGPATIYRSQIDQLNHLLTINKHELATHQILQIAVLLLAIPREIPLPFLPELQSTVRHWANTIVLPSDQDQRGEAALRANDEHDRPAPTAPADELAEIMFNSIIDVIQRRQAVKA